MHETLVLVSAWMAGTVLGAFFFGGLWWTVRAGIASRQPALWFLGSLLARMAMALSGLYLVSDHHWERLLACLLGFITARVAVNRMIRSPENALRATGAGNAA